MNRTTVRYYQYSVLMSEQSCVMRRLPSLSKEELLDVIECVSAKFGPSVTEYINDVVTSKQSAPDSSRDSVVEEHSMPVTETSQSNNSNKKKQKPQKVFDMNKYRQRHIALQVQYDGGAYHGFASQEGRSNNTKLPVDQQTETVEKQLFDKLLLLKLIKDRPSCHYSRCGRTDKGVSALGQVISLNIRSAIPLDMPEENMPCHPCDRIIISQRDELESNKNTDHKKRKNEDDHVVQNKEVKELDYCSILNSKLPDSIRVIGWSEVTDEFDARFSAASRTYRYFFIKRNLNIQLMNEAAVYLLGEHDFRNLCKIDIAHVTNFRREVISAKVVQFIEDTINPDLTTMMLEIKGVAFLWHMVRCIMSILFLVGQQKEDPIIIQKLLNINEIPAKPVYTMAPELPLVLHDCGYSNLQIHKQPKNLWSLCNHYELLWETHMVAAARVQNSLKYLQSCVVRQQDVVEFVKFFGDTTEEIAQIPDSKRFKLESNGSNALVSMVWGDVLRHIQDNYHVAPCDQSPLEACSMKFDRKYVPLVKREVADSYEDRLTNMSSGKREKLQQNKLKGAISSAEDARFFEKMQREGSKYDV